MVSSHFVEHLLRLKDEVHKVYNFEAMRHHLYFLVSLQLFVVTEIADELVRLAVHADLLQVIYVEVYSLLLQVTCQLIFARWLLHLFLFNHLH